MKVALILTSLLWIMTADFAHSSPSNNKRPCTKIYKPVCGSVCGKLIDFSNECVYRNAADRGSKLVWKGTCNDYVNWKKCQEDCPEYFQGACGSDGKTYAGSCYVDCHRCYEWGKQDLYVVKQGSCGKLL